MEGVSRCSCGSSETKPASVLKDWDSVLIPVISYERTRFSCHGIFLLTDLGCCKAYYFYKEFVSPLCRCSSHTHALGLSRSMLCTLWLTSKERVLYEADMVAGASPGLLLRSLMLLL